MYKLLVFLTLFSTPLIGVFASEGYIGEPIGLDFYTRIDENTESTVRAMTSARIKDIGTYGKLARNCQGKFPPWLANEKIDEPALREL
jgi:hypothetical protein